MSSNGSTATVAWRYFPASLLTVALTGSNTGCGVGSMAVTAKDARGAVVPGYRGTVHWTSTESTVTLPGNYTFTAADAGSHSFPVTFHKGGSQTLNATDAAGVTGGFSTNVIGSVCPATQLAITGLPPTAAAGAPVSVAVAAIDAYGGQTTNYTGSVSFSTSAQEAEPVQQAFLPADLGSRQLSVVFDLAGAGRVLTVTDDTDNTLRGSATLSVGAGDFTNFIIADVGIPLHAGLAFNVGVTAVDAFGNVVPKYTGTAHFSATDDTATLPLDYHFNGTENGEVVFDHAAIFRKIGSGRQEIFVQEPNSSHLPNGRVVSIAPAPPSCPGVTGNNWTGPTLTLNWCNFAANTDLYSILENGSILANLVPGYSYPVTGLQAGSDYTFTVQAERQHGARGGCGTFQSCLVFTYEALGSQQWSIDDSAPAVRFSVSGLPASVQTGTPATLTVRALDANGNLAIGYLGTVHFTSSDPAAALPADATFDSIQNLGVRTFPVSFGTPATAASVTATDSRAASITGTQSGIAVNGPALPPEPSLAPPPLDMHIATALADATNFIHSGPNAVQTGVLPNTIDITRAAMVRGNVLDPDGNGLGGVTVSVFNHPELGSTLSRATGGFDLAVNGGSSLNIVFNRAGYHPAQRQVTVPLQDYVLTQPVRLVPNDPQVSLVDLSDTANYHLLHGSLQTDARGSRTVKVFLPPGTQANYGAPDGGSVSGLLHMRATEYTVGDGGVDRMPATLPPTSRYTFAASFTADEELDAGVSNLYFTQTVYGYVENFLGFPVGTVIPGGHYDHGKANWVPHDNGVVLKIVGNNAGRAQIDSHGGGGVDPQSDLDALGISGSELTMLASNYTVGQSLWRVPMDHFSDEDWNLPPGPPPGSSTPKRPNPDRATPVACHKEVGGSIIECENQTLGERTPIAGTPYTLNYRSDRQLGRVANRRLSIPVGPTNIYTLQNDPALYEILQYAEVEVAGQPPNLRFDGDPVYEWNGLDAYGRRVQGSVPVKITVCSSGYPGYFYGTAAEVSRSFAEASAGGGSVFTSGATQAGNAVYTLCSPPWKGTIGGFDVKALGLGGWTISSHHAYDPVAAVIYKGDGTRQDAHDFNQPRSQAVFGYDQTGPGLHDGGKANLHTPTPLTGHLAADGAGNLYLSQNNRIWRIAPDGTAHLVGGGGSVQMQQLVDGMLATDAGFQVFQLAAGIHGEVYALIGNPGWRIIKIDANGILSVAAGTGAQGFSPDGTLATQASLNFNAFSVDAEGLTVHPDTGLLYFSEKFNNRVRKIAADGRLVTVAGGGPFGFQDIGTPAQFGGDGQDARASTALLDSPGALTFGPLPDRTLYFQDSCNRSVRSVDNLGVLHTVWGHGVHTCNTLQTGVALPTGLIATSDGQLVVARDDHNTYLLNPEDSDHPHQISGMISAATPRCTDVDCPAARIEGDLTEFAAAPDGTIWYVGNSNNATVNKLYPNIPITSATVSDIVLASQDGSEVYVFDGRGRHLRTLDALTSVPTQVFGYDLAGFLTTITDRSGNVTTINRDGFENPISIVSPFGQITKLQLGGDGYLASVTDPASQGWSMQYQPGGMLSQLVDARNGTHSFSYDDNGFLASDTNAVFATTTLDRHGNLAPALVTHSSPMGRNWKYEVTTGDDGTQAIKRTDPAGLVETTTVGADYKTISSSADGMSTSVTAAGDPRFGLNNSQYAGLWTASTPGGLVLSGSANKSAVLANPTDALTLSSLLESTTINGRSSSAAYTAATNTIAFTSAASRRATITLDALGRVASIAPPGVLPMQFHYDALGRNDTITQGTRVTRFGFEPGGYLNRITDPAGHVTTLSNDAVGRPTQATQPDSTTIAMSYDPSGNVTSVTPPGRPAHAFSYDLADEETLYTPPDAGVPMSTSTAYNPDQQVALVSRPDGDAITPGYDGTSGRLTTLTTAVEQATFGYSPDGGQLTSISKPAESLAYAYDGPLLTKVTWTGDVQGVLTRSYDNSFRIQSETVGGTTINYTYDNDDLLTDAGEMSIPRDPATGFVGSGATLGTLQEASTYDAYGALATYTVAKASNELVYKVDYGVRDQLGRVVDKTETIGGQVHSYRYGYDVNGRLVDVFNDGIAPGSTAWSATTSYAIGALVTLGTVEYQSMLNGNLNQQPSISPTSWALTHAYAYDPNGNRLVAPGLTASPAYDVQDRLISYGNCTYGYKRDGSLQTKTCPEGTTTYDYDAFGNLRHVGLPNGTAIDYVIDGQNRRVGKKVNGVMVEGFLYRSQLQPAAWLNGDGTVKAVFVYGLKPNVPEYMIKGGLKYRLITDQLGSVRLVVDPSGNIIERIDYDECGNVLADTAPGTQPFGFAGGVRDSSTGATRFGARDYDAVIGRWSAKDPLGFGGRLSNLYSYAGNDSVNLIDPDGHGSQGIHWGFVWNPTDQPLLVFGNDACGNQVSWLMAPHSTSLAPGNPFQDGDVDGVIVNGSGEIIKIRGILGSWINLPSWLTPASYDVGFIGFLFRNLGMNPVIPNFRAEFGSDLLASPPICKCGGTE